MKNYKKLFALLLVGCLPMISGWSQGNDAEKIYINRELLEITEDGDIVLYLVDEKVYLDAIYSDDAGIYVYASQVYKNGFWYCDFCNESHPSDWVACPYTDAPAPTVDTSDDFTDQFTDNQYSDNQYSDQPFAYQQDSDSEYIAY